LGAADPRVAWSQTAVPSIASIDFEGNTSVSDGRLRRAMRLRQPAWWNPFRKTPYLGPDYLTQDLYRVLDVYRDRGFPFATVEDAAVRLLDEGERVEIGITIDEGPLCTVGEIQLEGVDPTRTGPVRERTVLEPGDPLGRAKIVRTRDAIEAYYAEDGLLTTRVWTDVQIQGTVGVIRIHVVEGSVYTLRSVVIDTAASRLERTNPKVVTREVPMEPGDVLRTSRLLKTQDHLFETGVLRTVRVVPMPDTTGAPVADLRIIVHERNAGWYGFGAGYTSDDRIRLLAEWGNRNLGGMARRIEANGDIAFPLDRSLGPARFPVKSALVRLGYTEGWFLGTRTRSQTNLSHTYERLTSTSDQGQTVFDQDITSFEEVLSRSVGRHSVIGLGITNKWVRSGDPSATDDTYVTRNLSATLEEDRRNDILDPTQGTHFRGMAEYAGGLLGGTTEFSRWTLLGSWYFPLGRGVTFSTRARTGLIVPVGKGLARGDDPSRVSRIPIEERFRLGGGTSVRGYAENSLGRVDTSGVAVGGTALLLTNLELRFPIVWLIKGAIFTDAGNVWADPDEIRLERFTDGLDRGRRSPLNLAYGLGGGLRFVTPVGPFRVDYGWKLGGGQREKLPRGELHLSLGQAF
jgi:outer membrane protein assembly complex protein YaeT